MFVRRHIGSCLRCVDLGNAFSHLHAAAVQFVCEFRFATFISWTATEPRPDPRVDRLCDSSNCADKNCGFCSRCAGRRRSRTELDHNFTHDHIVRRSFF
jgi:hypothetical protein